MVIDPQRAATIYDVAKLARVSHQTVSRYVKGFEGIRPETRERVEAALRELDYRPNLAARFLATNRSHRIGALVYEMLEVGPSKILNGASRGARDAGYLLDIVSLDPSTEGSAESAVQMLNQQDLAGILAFAPTDEVNAAFAATAFTVPVFVETEDDDLLPGHERSLNGQGLQLLIDHLVALGHRRFFHIAGPAEWLSSRNRVAAYDFALAGHGLTSLGMVNGDWTAESGYLAVASMPLDRGITAIVVSNDQMALGAMRRLEELGIGVPHDMSVVGFDDIPESAYFSPPLTTVRLDFDTQGRIAVARLLVLIGEPDATAALEPVSPVLRIRGSSGPAPSAA